MIFLPQSIKLVPKILHNKVYDFFEQKVVEHDLYFDVLMILLIHVQLKHLYSS
jgi:hypothetical protein